MTARDDAANIAADALASGYERGECQRQPCPFCAERAAAVLDALAARPDVLAAWAAEVGALEQVGVICSQNGVFHLPFDWEWLGRQRKHKGTAVPVFRVADRTEKTPS